MRINSIPLTCGDLIQKLLYSFLLNVFQCLEAKHHLCFLEELNVYPMISELVKHDLKESKELLLFPLGVL